MIYIIIGFALLCLLCWHFGDKHGYTRRQIEEERGNLNLTLCNNYVEDPAICFDNGEPKGQCVNCGDKWYNHRLQALPEEERASARAIQERTRRFND